MSETTIPSFETERLSLSPLHQEDAADIFEIQRDERAMRFMPSLPHKRLEETEGMIAYHLQNRLQGARQWAIRYKGQAKVLGVIDYLGATRITGMGYYLHPNEWGKGIIVEAARPIIDYGFRELGYNRIELWIDEKNKASRRVAEKLGFGVKGRMALKYNHEEENHFSLVYGILAADWLEEEKSPKQAQFFMAEPVWLVHDVLATAEFYRDKLGFNIDFLYGFPPTHAGVSRGEWNGNLVSIQLAQVPVEREFSASANLHIRVSNVDALYEDYRSKDVEIDSVPEDKPWGFREFAIKDNNGYRLVFASYC